MSVNEPDKQRVTPSEAIRLVEQNAQQLPDQTVKLEDCCGRTLSQDIKANAPSPRFMNSAMDGFAVIASDLKSAATNTPIKLKLIGESQAGLPLTTRVKHGETAAISTGAMLPTGTDTVIRIEDVTISGESVEFKHSPKVGDDVRKLGEDYQVGETLIRGGTKIEVEQLGVLASLGLGELPCTRRPTTSVITTGDELCSPDEPLKPGEIYNSNSYVISALATQAGAQVQKTLNVGDNFERTKSALAQELDNDLILICGGISVGKHDHVKQALSDLGVVEKFWGVAQRPGGPLWFGIYPRPNREPSLIFGLPGNPVSAAITFQIYVRRAIAKQLGINTPPKRMFALLAEPIQKAAGKVVFVRVSLTTDNSAVLHAHTTGPQGSHLLTSMLGAEAVVITPAELDYLPAGSVVEVELL